MFDNYLLLVSCDEMVVAYFVGNKNVTSKVCGSVNY